MHCKSASKAASYTREEFCSFNKQPASATSRQYTDDITKYTKRNVVLHTQQALPEDTPLPCISRSVITLLTLGKVSAESDSQGGNMESAETGHCACCMLCAEASRLAGPSGKGMMVCMLQLSLSLLLLASSPISAATHTCPLYVCQHSNIHLRERREQCFSQPNGCLQTLKHHDY